MITKKHRQPFRVDPVLFCIYLLIESHLTEARSRGLKEQQAQIEEQKKLIEVQKNENNQLKARILEIEKILQKMSATLPSNK